MARRVLALSAASACAYGSFPEGTVEWLKREELWPAASPRERQFLTEPTSQHERIQFTWRVEALVPLLWAIMHLESMPGWEGECDPALLAPLVVWPPAATKRYVASATLRSPEAIHSEYEKIYDAHWAVRNTALQGLPAQGGHPGVIYQRHYAFNWLTRYKGQDWDNIYTDT